MSKITDFHILEHTTSNKILSKFCACNVATSSLPNPHLIQSEFIEGNKQFTFFFNLLYIYVS